MILLFLLVNILHYWYKYILYIAAVLSLQGSLEIFTGLGLIMGPPVGGWFYQSFGYEVPFLLLGCFLLIMVPFNIYVLPTIGSSLWFQHINRSFRVISKYFDFEYLFVLLSTQRPIPRRIRSFDFSPKWKSSSSATPYSLLARDWASWMPRCPCLLWRRYNFFFSMQSSRFTSTNS